MEKVEKQIILNRLVAINNFVNLACRYQCDVQITSGYHTVDGKSILGILSLELYRPVTVVAQGKDAAQFADGLDEIQLQ